MGVGKLETGRSNKLSSIRIGLDHHYAFYLTEVDILNLLDIYTTLKEGERFSYLLQCGMDFKKCQEPLA